MNRPNPTDVRRTCLDLIAATPVFYLTTLGADGYPHTTAMCNLRCAAEYPTLAEFQAERGDDLTLFTSTCMGSDKIGRIRANPKVSAYLCDPKQIVGFMLAGRILRTSSTTRCPTSAIRYDDT